MRRAGLPTWRRNDGHRIKYFLPPSVEAQTSVKAVAAVLRRRRIPATAVDADEAGLLTDGRFGRALPLPEAYPNLRKSLRAVKGVPVVSLRNTWRVPMHGRDRSKGVNLCQLGTRRQGARVAPKRPMP